ncbi:MAG: hypothetical protein ABI166_00040, partial [Mucilaginibacter sp.]
LLISTDQSLETEEGTPTEDTVLCPNCHSVNTRYGQATERKHSWLGIAISLLASITFIVGIYPFFARKTWHCFNCGKDFERIIK